MSFDESLKKHTNILLEMAYGADPNATQVSSFDLARMISSDETTDKPIKFTSITKASQRKTNRETGERIQAIWKVSQVDAITNVNYQQRRTDAGREAGELQSDQEYELRKNYGEHLTPGILEHNNKLYLQVIPQSALAPQYIMQDVIGKLTHIPKEQADPYLGKPYVRGDSGDSVPIRRYKLESLVAVELDNQDYRITDVKDVFKDILDMVNIDPQRFK